MNTLAEPLTTGFGTVLFAEHRLMERVKVLLDAETGVGNLRAHRILEHNAWHLGVIMALLEQRDRLLPHPGRFDHLEHGQTGMAHATLGSAAELDFPFQDLVRRNHALVGSLSSLIEHSGHKDEDERGLREASERQIEMEWILNALLRERTARVPAPGVAVAAEAAEGAWENEGGHTSPTRRAGEAV